MCVTITASAEEHLANCFHEPFQDLPTLIKENTVLTVLIQIMIASLLLGSKTGLLLGLYAISHFSSGRLMSSALFL